MGVRLSTSYRLLDGTNSDIGLTSVVTDGRLRIGNPNVDTSCGPAGQSSIRITVSTAVGSVIVVTVDAAEALRNVRSAVFARRRGIGRRPWSDRHADHPPNRPLTVRRCGKRGLYQVGRRRLRTTPRRARFATRVWSTSNLLGSISPQRRPFAVAHGFALREKWAGADSNCGYGHPKAEGYQATPPARIYNCRRRIV